MMQGPPVKFGLELLTALGGVDVAPKAASKLIRAGANAVAPAREEQDPIKALLEIALDDALAEVFRASLKDLGFELYEQHLPANPFNPSDSSERTVSIAARPRLDFFLICVPYWLLNDDQQNNLAAFDFLSYAFPKNSIVHIISRGLLAMDYGFEGLIKSWRVVKIIDADFIPWSRIVKLQRARDARARTTLEADRK